MIFHRQLASGVNLLLVMLIALTPTAWADSSTCYGTTSKGKLVNGVELPRRGENFISYSDIARFLGRTYVHSEVNEIVVAAYDVLAKKLPEKVYKYAETGFENGGQFKPHKTHRNGLSVDFMTPMINASSESVHLPTYPWNKFGYSIELDSEGRIGNMRVDYQALAAHLVELDKAAKARGHKIWRVIFDPELQPGLYTTEYGDYIRQHITLSKKRAWVRHDEHYHVDFDIPCKAH